MITQLQLKDLSNKFKTNETVVLREYYQLLWLNYFYSLKGSSKVYFKGGTAIHLIYGAPRFSEDLDFTVDIDQDETTGLVNKTVKLMEMETDITLKERETISGKRFLITMNPAVVKYKIFINLDFSFREKIFEPEKVVVETSFPIIFTTFVNTLSQNEILAEKVRAILNRKKGRDIYDLWYLLSKNTKIDDVLVQNKLDYYNTKYLGAKSVLDRIDEFKKEDFILDLRPFLPVSQRDKIGDFYDYLRTFLSQKLEK